MKHLRLQISVMIAALLGIAAVGGAQLVGPIPPATPTTPEYVPPERRNIPRVDVPETAPIAPSIIEKDAQGRLRPLNGTPEQVAVAAYPFDAGQREKIAASSAARTLDLDRFVVQSLDKVIAARKMQAKVESASDFGELFVARDIVAGLRFERLIDRLERDRAITLAQRIRLDEALLAYDRARKAEIEQGASADPTRTAILNLRQTFADATREPFESLERQLGNLSGNRAALRIALQKSSLRQDQQTEWDRLNAQFHIFPNGGEQPPASLPSGWIRSFFYDVLDMEQRRVFLTAGLAQTAPQPEK